MRKLMIILLCLLLPAAALAELTVDPLEGELHPGKAVLLSFNADAEDTAVLALTDDSGSTVMTVSDSFAVQPGLNRMYWNGTSGGEFAPLGEWQLTVTLSDGTSASAPVTVGSRAPVLENVTMDDTLDARLPFNVTVSPTQAGTLSVSVAQEDNELLLDDVTVDAGETVYTIPAHTVGTDFTDGSASLILSVTNEAGVSSTSEYFDITLYGLDENDDSAAMDQSQFTPSYGSPYAFTGDEPVSSWNTPMDITDTERIWQMLTAPITVTTTGKNCSEKAQITIRSEPDMESEGVGVVTCLTQAVRVIEQTDDGWSLIECYSSSFHDSKVKSWNELVQGWIKTSYLKTITPSQKMGIIVDKLTQRLYIFVNGELYDTLLCSTGVANAKQPYNETRSGEFILTSKVGEFRSDNLYCAMAIRFNSGDLLHEVPHTLNKDGSSNYSTAEPKLGTRASHGCIRVQRRKTSKGTNMTWLWNNFDRNTKIVIWEDWQGRVYPYPDDDTVLYYNPNSGDYYHTAETCYMAKKVTFTPFTYGQLEDEEFASLKRCTWCTAPLRKSEIDEINENYLPGGDHDPVLTEARAKEWD